MTSNLLPKASATLDREPRRASPGLRATLMGRGAGALALAALALQLAACAVPVTRTTRVEEAPGYRHVEPVYARYGTVQRIETVDTHVGDSGGGAVMGGVVGGVLGNLVGHGNGRAAATALGVFGGAVLGDNTERANAAAESGRVYHVLVGFDDGGRQTFSYSDLRGLHTGERVKLEQGVLLRG